MMMRHWTLSGRKKALDIFISRAFCGVCCLAVTYFRERKLTIIGALLFHGPVREGKGWDQQAIAARRSWETN